MSISRLMQLAASGGTETGGWDISTTTFDGGDLPRFRMAQASLVEGNPTGLSFKSDGTKMYYVGTTYDRVYECDLSTAWDISTASYLQNFSVAAQESNPQGLFFKPDGTKMYIVGSSGDDVNEYDLSTAWDISTASYLQNFSVAAQEITPVGVFFKSDGTKMYIVGSAGDDVNEYDLSTAWDVSTASYLQNFSVAAQSTLPTDLSFKSDGTKMYVCGTQRVFEYNLSTAWDVTSASYSQQFFIGSISVLAGPVPNAVFFKSDGTEMYVADTSYDSVFQFNLSTAWDVSTATYAQPTSDYYEITSYPSVAGICFKPDGTKLYFAETGTNRIIEFNLSTAWDVSTLSDSTNYIVVTSQDGTPSGVFFKPDGLSMYMVGTNNDSVYQYSLSTAWNVSTATYVQSFSVSTQATGPTQVSFNSDGTRMFILNTTTDGTFQYALSTAWDISTASYTRGFSVFPQTSSYAEAMFFKPDGTKMYICGGGTKKYAFEYDLSTAWDLGSASYLQSFDITKWVYSTSGLGFRPNGKQMYVLDPTVDVIFDFTLA